MHKDLLGKNFEYVSCNLCGGDQAKTLIRAKVNASDFEKEYRGPDMEFQIQKCLRCGLIYLNPRLKASLAQSFYTEHLQDMLEIHQNYFKSYLYKMYYKLTRKMPLIKKGAILDIGCGSGRYLAFLRSLGWQVKGIEPDVALYTIAKDFYGLDVFNGLIEEFQCPEEAFDVITLFQTLEHVPSPKAVLSRCFDLLKRNGVLIIGNQPNFNSLDQMIFKAENSALGIPYHLYHFDEATLAKLCKTIGFEIERVEYELFVPTQLTYNFLNILAKRLKLHLSTSNKLLLCAVVFPLLLPIYSVMKWTKTSMTFAIHLRKRVD
ncbi:class I SAM-dependent methyltransferase [Candidatus Margulisiibacteriota bacterium]